jgi:hypothetical protein
MDRCEKFASDQNKSNILASILVLGYAVVHKYGMCKDDACND